MASISVTYIDAHSCYASGDQRDNVSPGMALRANCGDDGIKVAYLRQIDYKNGVTTFYMAELDSDDFTSNLVSIDFSCIRTPFNKNGNLPIELMALYRGFKGGLLLSWVSTTQITINPGSCHFYFEGREFIGVLESAVTINITSLVTTGNYTWYYVYIRPPKDESCIIDPSINSFMISLVPPTYNSTYMGYYFGTGYERCIGFFITSGEGQVKHFVMTNDYYIPSSSPYTSLNAPSNVYQSLSLYAPAITDIMIFFNASSNSNSGSENDWRSHYFRPYDSFGDTGFVTIYIGKNSDGTGYGQTSQLFAFPGVTMLNNTHYCQLKLSSNPAYPTSWNVYFCSVGYSLPYGLSSI